MSNQVKHRGPDTSEFETIVPIPAYPFRIHFGFHRLSINNVKRSGDQPMYVPFTPQPTKRTIQISDPGSIPISFQMKSPTPAPLPKENIILVCNGEIYNSEHLRVKYNLSYSPRSDCEIISRLFLYFRSIVDIDDTSSASKPSIRAIKQVINVIRGVYAFVLYDSSTKLLFATRDYPFGVRPMYSLSLFKKAGGVKNSTGLSAIGFSSEAKCFTTEIGNSQSQLTDTVVSQMKPSEICMIDFEKSNPDSKELYHTFIAKNIPFYNLGPSNTLSGGKQSSSIQTVTSSTGIENTIKELVYMSVNARLMSDRPIGCFLSGGLDSSIVTAVALELLLTQKRISAPSDLHTFSIGIAGGNSKDLEFARRFAKELGTTHHEVLFTFEEGLESLSNVIRALESFDTTTIRASVPMYLLSKYISKNTDIKVVLSGEGADELFGGYLYFKSAPSPDAFDRGREEALTKLRYYDVLRSDRVTAVHGLEIRVPFLDFDFAKVIINTPCTVLQPPFEQEKYMLRKAFRGVVPEYIRTRQKDAFSDAVGHSWVDNLTTHFNKKNKYDLGNKTREVYCPPRTREEFHYRLLFETEYPNRAQDFLPYGFWHPKWSSETLTDPSARKLIHYCSTFEKVPKTALLGKSPKQSNKTTE